MWAGLSARHEETSGHSDVKSPDEKHEAEIRSGEEYFHDSVELDGQTVALSKTFWLFDVQWKGPQTLVVKYLPNDLPNETNRPAQFDEQLHQVGDVHIDYERISRAEIDRFLYGGVKKAKPHKAVQKKTAP